MSNAKVSAPKQKSKYPTFVCRARWSATACNLLIIAKDEDDAWERAWRRISRTEGGDRCLDVKIIRRLD